LPISSDANAARNQCATTTEGGAGAQDHDDIAKDLENGAVEMKHPKMLRGVIVDATAG